jgi:hypothetical protein
VAADLEEFAAAHEIFVQRFGEWIAYLADLAPDETPAAAAEAARANGRAITAATAAVPTHIAPEIPEQLTALEEALNDGGAADPPQAAGFYRSLKNVVARIAERVVQDLPALPASTQRLPADVVKELRPELVKAGAKGVLNACLGFLVDAAKPLLELSVQLPVLFGWVGPLLSWLGLLH